MRGCPHVQRVDPDFPSCCLLLYDRQLPNTSNGGSLVCIAQGSVLLDHSQPSLAQSGKLAKGHLCRKWREDVRGTASRCRMQPLFAPGRVDITPVYCMVNPRDGTRGPYKPGIEIL